MFCLWGGRGLGREKIVLGRGNRLYKSQSGLAWKQKTGEDKYSEGRILGLGNILTFLLSVAKHHHKI